jgi:hypothetical protein
MFLIPILDIYYFITKVLIAQSRGTLYALHLALYKSPATIIKAKRHKGQWGSSPYQNMNFEHSIAKATVANICKLC